MKRKIEQIVDKITKIAENKRTSAAYSGERNDGGASQLENSLNLFTTGVKTALLAVKEKTDLLDVPKQWEDYFIDEDPEYQEFLRLKEKFKKS